MEIVHMKCAAGLFFLVFATVSLHAGDAPIQVSGQQAAPAQARRPPGWLPLLAHAAAAADAASTLGVLRSMRGVEENPLMLSRHPSAAQVLIQTQAPIVLVDVLSHTAWARSHARALSALYWTNVALHAGCASNNLARLASGASR